MSDEKPLDIKFKNRFFKNLLSNIIYFILSIIVGLCLVPYFLDTLGPSAYGLIPLATSLTSYITLFIDGVNESISRYLTIDLQQGNNKKANLTYNTAVFGTLGILILMVPIGIAAALFAPVFFDIGTVAPSDVALMFGLVIASIFVRAWSSNFMVILFAHNRLELRNVVNIVNLLSQILMVVLLFSFFGPSLPFVGLSYLIAAVLSLLVAYLLSKKVAPNLKISKSAFEKRHLKEMVGTSLWIILAKMGSLLRSNVALIIVNITIGTLAGTDYSLVLTWFTLIISIISLVTSCFIPMTYAYRAKDDKNGLIKFTKITVKIVTLATALLVGLVCVFSEQLMTIWVGEEYARLAPLMWIVLIGCLFSVQSSCCQNINAAYLRVRPPAYANLIAGGINIGLAIILPTVFGLGVYGVAFATTITTLFLSGFFSPMLGAHILNVKLTTFQKPAIAGYLAFVILAIVGTQITHMLSISGIFGTILFGCIFAILFCSIVWIFVFKKEERMLVLGMMPSFIMKKIPQRVKNY